MQGFSNLGNIIDNYFKLYNIRHNQNTYKNHLIYFIYFFFSNKFLKLKSVFSRHLKYINKYKYLLQKIMQITSFILTYKGKYLTALTTIIINFMYLTGSRYITTDKRNTRENNQT